MCRFCYDVRHLLLLVFAVSAVLSYARSYPQVERTPGKIRYYSDVERHNRCDDISNTARRDHDEEFDQRL